MIHHCHAIDCRRACPPKHLFCAPHWAMVPKALADEVYRTVVLRRKRIDETWAPWWRAAHRAIDHVYREELRTRTDLTEEQRTNGFVWAAKALAKDLAFADELEADETRAES